MGRGLQEERFLEYPHCSWGGKTLLRESESQGAERRSPWSPCPQGHLGHLSSPTKVLWGQDQWLPGGRDGGGATNPLALTGRGSGLFSENAMEKGSCSPGRRRGGGTYQRSRRAASSWAPHLPRAGGSSHLSRTWVRTSPGAHSHCPPPACPPACQSTRPARRRCCCCCGHCCQD